MIGHACIMIETKGLTILSDPWWRGPCFGAQWWNYPAPCLDPLVGKKIDYIYISHGHHDHLHPGTLNTLDKDATVIVSDTADLGDFIRGLGFKVLEAVDGVETQLGVSGVSCRIMATHGDDTLMVLSDGSEVCANLNDALHSAPRAVQSAFITRLNALYPQIDYVFCGYGSASHFPNCYVIPGKDYAATAAQRQHYFNEKWARIIADLRPRWGFPFAADVAFFEEDLLWANEPTQNTERPTTAFSAMYPTSPVHTVDIAPGFVIADGVVLDDRRRQAVSEATLRTDYAAHIARANTLGTVDALQVDAMRDLVEENVTTCLPYLRSHESDYRFLIHFKKTDFGIAIVKQKDEISVISVKLSEIDRSRCNIIFSTRLPYLRWSLTKQYGDEIIFVGSGGIFEYLRREDAATNLHRELVVMLRSHPVPPVAVEKKESRLMSNVKKTVKQLLGRGTEDLYDLDTWTIYGKSHVISRRA